LPVNRARGPAGSGKKTPEEAVGAPKPAETKYLQAHPKREF
jgi:hypothetical protein